MSDSIPFWKMSGSGNDFVVIDNRLAVLVDEEVFEFTRAVCRHRLSVGADGVVLISNSRRSDIDFDWRYINADGSDGEMCGNGAMCGARFAFLHDVCPADCTFSTPSGDVQAWVDPLSPRVRIAMPDAGTFRCDISLTVAGRSFATHALLVGVPHAVTICADVDAFAPGDKMTEIGREVRRHPEFQPAGTNFNLIAIQDRSTIRMRTYERGVEAETLACGTGAMASAIVASTLGLTDPPVSVITSSGGILEANFSLDQTRATSLSLGGEARVIARGEICAEALDGIPAKPR